MLDWSKGDSKQIGFCFFSISFLIIFGLKVIKKMYQPPGFQRWVWYDDIAGQICRTGRWYYIIDIMLHSYWYYIVDMILILLIFIVHMILYYIDIAGQICRTGCWYYRTEESKNRWKLFLLKFFIRGEPASDTKLRPCLNVSL